MSGVIRSAPLQLRVAGAVFAAALTVTPSSVCAATMLPNGTYFYEITENGKAEATSKIVVTRTPAGILVSEHAEPMEAAEVTRRTFDGAPFAARTFADEVDGHAYTTVAIDGNTAVLERGGKKTTLTAPPDAPFAVFDMFAASLFQLPALLHAAPANRLTLANLFFGSPTVALAAEPGAAARPKRVPATDVSTQVALDGKPGALWYDPASYVLDEFDMPAERISFILTSRNDVVTSLP
jgi:hypothetical protein